MKRLFEVLMVTVVGVTLAGPAFAGDASEARVEAMLKSFHGVSHDVLEKLNDADYAVLLQAARDTEQPLYVRTRALGMVGIRPGADAEALWQEARAWPERELRIQAAYAQAMARYRQEGALRPFLQELLSSRDADMREVAVQVMLAPKAPESGMKAGALKALAQAHLTVEKDARLRALIERRLAE